MRLSRAVYRPVPGRLTVRTDSHGGKKGQPAADDPRGALGGEQAGRLGPVVQRGAQSTCQQWPFRQLHYQLGKKLSLRVNNEISPKDEEFAEFKKGIISMIFEDLKYTKDELQTILEMIYLNAEYIKKYPNTLDSLSLLVSYNHEQSPINDLRSELTENQTQQLLQEIFDFNLKNYYQFIQCHNAIFSRISEIVDNDFVVEKLIIRDGEGKKICKFNKEKEFCITQRAKKEIKTFSELLKHVKLEPLMSHAEKNFPNEDTNKVE